MAVSPWISISSLVDNCEWIGADTEAERAGQLQRERFRRQTRPDVLDRVAERVRNRYGYGMMDRTLDLPWESYRIE